MNMKCARAFVDRQGFVQLDLSAFHCFFRPRLAQAKGASKFMLKLAWCRGRFVLACLFSSPIAKQIVLP